MQFARKSRAFNSCRLGSTLCKTLPTCAVHDLAVHAGTGDLVAGKGVVKVRCKNRYEVQIDTETAKILQVAVRRSDLIESIHDGSYFNDHFKLWVFLPAGIVLAMLVITGIYLFLLPYLVRRKRVR